MKWTKRIPKDYNFKQAIDAIKECIKVRWKPRSMGKYGDRCVLCFLYLNDQCEFCPISFKTSSGGCKETPFFNWLEAWFKHDYKEQIHYAKEEIKLLARIAVELKDEWKLRRAKNRKVKK